MTQRKKQVVIGYTERMFSQGLESIIDGFDDYIVFDRARIGQKLLALLDRLKSVEILIIEIKYPTQKDLDYITSLVKNYPVIQILLISHLPPINIGRELIESGIDAYLLKECSKHDVLIALNKIVDSKNYFCSDITKVLLSSNRECQVKEETNLTLREKDILAGLVNGRTNGQIGEDLGISENTIKTHRRNIQSKFGVNNLLGMVRFAFRANLIDFREDEFCMNCPHLTEIKS